MRGLVVPDIDEDFTADGVELYFDLAFVFAFSQLVAFLVHEHSIVGIWKSLLLFLLLWMAWSQFTWSANAISSSSRVVRSLFLIATVATIPMGASIQSAFEGGGRIFAIAWLVVLAMGQFAMISGLETGSDEWRSAIRLSRPSLLSGVLVFAGGFASGDTRIVLWILGLVSIVLGTVLAGSDSWIIRVGHFAERHALIVIVALGEVIVAVGIPVVNDLLGGEDGEGAGLPANSLLALVASGAFAALLWWAYFDRLGPALEHRAEELDGIALGNYARDVYTYGHFPLVGGVILAAAGLEEVTLHPSDTLPAAFLWMLGLGLGLFLFGAVATAYRSFRIIAKERLIGIALIAVLLIAGQSLEGLVLLALIDLVLLLTLVAEHLRIEGPS